MDLSVSVGVDFDSSCGSVETGSLGGEGLYNEQVNECMVAR